MEGEERKGRDMRRMIRFIPALAFWLLVQAQAVHAQEIKVGYIDSIRLFSENNETSQAEEIFNKELQAWKDQADRMAREVAQLRDEIRGQSLMLSEEKRKEKVLELEKKDREFQEFYAQIFDPGGRAETRNLELTKPIIDKINRILTRIGEEDDYTLILDVANASVVYAKKELDLTDRVLEELNSGSP